MRAALTMMTMSREDVKRGKGQLTPSGHDKTTDGRDTPVSPVEEPNPRRNPARERKLPVRYRCEYLDILCASIVILSVY